MRSLGNAYKNFVGTWSLTAPPAQTALTLNGNAAAQALTVSGGTLGGQFTANSYQSTLLYAGISAYMQSLPIAGIFSTFFGLNASYDGSNWRTGTDGANNAGSAIISSYGSGAIGFYTIPSTGGTNQSISNASFAANLRMSIAGAGNVSINAPTSGVALSVSGVAASITSPQLNVSSSSTSSAAVIGLTDGQTGTRQWALSSGAGSPGQFSISDATAGLVRLAIGTTGAVTINSPTSNLAALSISGPSTSYTQLQMNITGSYGNGAGIGFVDGETGNRAWAIGAGFSTVGYFGIYDASAPALRLSIDLSGNINIPNGTGTLSPVYAGIPQNIQNNNYTFVLSDANKQILHNIATAHTYTIPANATVPYPIGTCITIVNGGQAGGTLTLSITSDTIQFFPSGATGSRTLAPYSQVTLNKVTSTVWTVTGVGIT